VFGYEPDNHAVNTVPKETLVRVTFAEAGGMGGERLWRPAASGRSPGAEDDVMRTYLSGGFVRKMRR
jgi:nitrate reductase alpha subunit